MASAAPTNSRSMMPISMSTTRAKVGAGGGVFGAAGAPVCAIRLTAKHITDNRQITDRRFIASLPLGLLGHLIQQMVERYHARLPVNTNPRPQACVVTAQEY